MGYQGDSIADLFDGAEAATELALHRMADRAGARMVEVTRINTPVDSGELRGSWYQLPVTRARVGNLSGWQSGVATDVEYAPHVEWGTGLWGPRGRKYLIEPKTPGGVLHWRDPQTGESVFARRVWHPGSPGNHMVGIAANVVEHEAEQTLFAGIVEDWRTSIEAGA